jgi:O-antigen/teichoic acid export membrane protein
MGLRNRALQGGAIMVVRQGIGTLLSLIGVLVITRLVGPSQYGLYASAFGIVLFCSTFGTWGIDVYLLRKATEPAVEEYRQGFTLLFAISSVFSLVLLFGHSLIAEALHLKAMGSILMFLALGLPFSLMNLPSVVRLDRDLNFKQVAFNELTSQLLYYVVALPLAFGGMGAWAPAGGWVTQQLVLFALSAWSAKMPFGLHWDRKLIRKMLTYGLAYSSSIWVWQLRTLVNPVLVGRFAGAEAVAYVALAIRITEVLAFAKNATWRIALAALAKLQSEPHRLRRAIEEGMALQAMAVGLPLAVFALIAPILLPLVFGERWMPMLIVFPWIALGYLTNSMFNLHSSVLYLLQKNHLVTRFNLLHIALFVAGTYCFVPQFGFVGYGWGELIALLSYPLIHAYLKAQVGRPEYTPAFVWYCISVAMLLATALPEPLKILALFLPLLPFSFPGQRELLGEYARILKPQRGIP